MSDTPNVITTAPPRIFLVIGEDCPASEEFKNLFEVSWCASDIDGNGIEYLRVDQPITDSEALRLADAIELRVENRAERMVIADKLRNLARRKAAQPNAPQWSNHCKTNELTDHFEDLPNGNYIVLKNGSYLSYRPEATNGN